jgi:hypothetical protein
VVAEPYSVPDSPNWVGDLEGSTAIGWTTTTTSSAPGALLDRGNGSVAVEWAWIAVVGVYVSPNSCLDAYGDFLDGVSNCIRRRCRSRQVLIQGDFNSRSSHWGDTRTNTCGRMLFDWAAGLGLLLTNRGSTSTCVAWRGSSVVDITWTTASLHRRIRNWRVVEEVETLSHHLYIMMELTSSTHRSRHVRGVPAKNSKGGDVYLSPLPRGGRHGTAHTGALPSVGRTAPRTTPHHWRYASP